LDFLAIIPFFIQLLIGFWFDLFLVDEIDCEKKREREKERDIFL